MWFLLGPWNHACFAAVHTLQIIDSQYRSKTGAIRNVRGCLKKDCNNSENSIFQMFKQIQHKKTKQKTHQNCSFQTEHFRVWVFGFFKSLLTENGELRIEWMEWWIKNWKQSQRQCKGKPMVPNFSDKWTYAKGEIHLSAMSPLLW